MNKQEMIEKAQASVKDARVQLGEAEAAEAAQQDLMTRQPSGRARVEWMRRLTALNNAMLALDHWENVLVQANAIPDEPAAVPQPEPAPSAETAAPEPEPAAAPLQ